MVHMYYYVFTLYSGQPYKLGARLERVQQAFGKLQQAPHMLEATHRSTPCHTSSFSKPNYEHVQGSWWKANVPHILSD